MSTSTADRVIVVTGAASGMGRATVRRLARDGAIVVGVDADERGLWDLTDELGERVRVVVGDVSVPETHSDAVELAATSGALTGWVNAAGIWVSTWAHRLVFDDFKRVVEVNLFGVALGCAAACEQFLRARSGGAIVNISSIDALVGFPDGYAYDASKGGVDALTRQVAIEYGVYGIRCNGVRPGTIMTGLTEAFLEESDDREETLQAWREQHPLRRIGAPEEVAAVIRFLLSADAAFITGELVNVDGGATARCFGWPPNPNIVFE